MSIRSRRTRRLAAAGLLTLASAAGVATSASAAKLTLTYQCTYPLIGEAPLKVDMDVALPTVVVPGKPTAEFKVNAIATASGKTYDGLSLVGAAKLSGSARAGSTVRLPGGANLPVAVPITIDPYTVPRAKQDLVLTASGSTPSLTFPRSGEATISVDSLSLSLKATKADGTAVIFPGSAVDSDQDETTFDVACRLDPADQNTTLASIRLPDPCDAVPMTTPTGAFLVTGTSALLAWPPSTCREGFVEDRLFLFSNEMTGPQQFATATGGQRQLVGLETDTPYTVIVRSVYRSAGVEVVQPTPIATFQFKTGSNPQTGPDPAPPGSVTPPVPAASHVLDTSARLTVDTFGPATTPTAFRVSLQPTGGPGSSQNITFQPTPSNTLASELTGLLPGTTYRFSVGQAYPDGVPPSGPTAPYTSGSFTTAGTLPATTPVPPITTPEPPVTTPVKPPTLPPPPTEPVAYGFSLNGTATLKTLVKGTLPLRGSIAAKLDLATGSFTADLALAQASAKLTALGFLPVTASVAFVSTAPTTGSLAAGILTANAKVRIKLPKVSLFGLPLAGGATCQTKSASSIALRSTDPVFSPLEGGALAGTFAISDLSGCGALNGIVSSLTAGKGNAIALRLTPQG